MLDKDGTERTLTVAQDDGIRPGSSLEGLAKLPPAFKAGGSTTAGEWGRGQDRRGRWGRGRRVMPASPCSGNSSQVSDGAAAVLIGRRAAVEALGLPVLGVLRASAVVGVPPDVMGIGPAFAIPAALKRAGKMPVAMVSRSVWSRWLKALPVQALAWTTWTCSRSTRPSPAR